MLMGWCARTEVFLWIFVERPLAAERAKIVSRAFVLGLSRGHRRINIHAADDIMYRVLHLVSLFHHIMLLPLVRV